MLLSCVGVGFAQVDTPPNAVPKEAGGKDYAGRPVADVEVPPARLLPANEQQQFRQDVKDIHFDFDRYDLRAEDRTILAAMPSG
jgi:outer membrane protein OmpA-like peptidoglycan-associated protein